MKTLEAHRLIFSSDYPDLDSVSAALDTLLKNNIEQLNWAGFDYKPIVIFNWLYGS